MISLMLVLRVITICLLVGAAGFLIQSMWLNAKVRRLLKELEKRGR